MSIFEIILSPFVYLIKQLFLFSFKLTGDYGISIVLLSLFISIILLPVFILIEKAKKKDDALKFKMKPFIDEIKRCYKGQERYYYLKTLNRQYGYSPVHALIPILSLLLQIPFFIAAYQFLEAYEPLRGDSFLFIKDLSLPDAVIGSINILPIVMTLVNLVTAFFYTRNGNTAERRQMVIVAGVFLLLLYKLPAGLLLYWTMNNVFSFFRLFITNPEVFRKGKQKEQNAGFFKEIKIWSVKYKILFRKVYLLVTLLILVTQVYWAMNANFDDFIIRALASPIIGFVLAVFILFLIETYKIVRPKIHLIKVAPILYFSSLLLSAYFYMASEFYFKEVNKELLNLAFLLTIFSEAIGLLYFFRMRNKISRKLFFASSYLVFLLLIIQSTNLISYFNGKEISILAFNSRFLIDQGSLTSSVASGIFLSALCLPFYIFQSKYSFSVSDTKRYGIVVLSLLYITGLLFFWNPMIVYASYPDNFNFPAISFLSNNFIPFCITISVAFLMYIILPGKIKQFILVLYLSIAILTFLYSSIIPFDVGTLQVNFFSNDENLLVPWYYYLAEALLLYGVVLGVVRSLQKNYNKKIVFVLVVLNVFLIGQGLYSSIGTGEFFHKQLRGKLTDEQKTNEISFSKTEENVLLFVIDGAQGWYMHDLVAEDSNLRNDYNGFVYYPNALAMSNFTYASVPSMMSGYDFSISELNKNENETIIEKVTDATELFYKNIKDRDYFFASTILRYSNIDHSKFDSYIPRWDEEWTRRLAIDKSNEMWYTRLWENALFSSVPLFLKAKVYNNRKWVIKDNPNINSSDLQKYNFVRVLPDISNNTSKQKNFIYIHSLFTHTPWDFISDENKLTRNVTPYKNQQWFTYTFAKWIKWMKENEVYDNTKIILVSDHGPSWWHFEGEIDPGTAPLVWSENEYLTLGRFLHLNPLILVKDFYRSEPLKEDWRLMSNADVYSIAFDINDPTKSDSTSRTLPTFSTRWHTDLPTRTKYEIRAEFLVTDYVFDMNNWKEIK